MKIDVEMDGLAEMEAALKEVDVKLEELHMAIHTAVDIRKKLVLKINQPSVGEAGGQNDATDQNES